MRRMFRIAGWIGVSLSALLCVATIVVWVRSLGHIETWEFWRFGPHPEWKTGLLARQGTVRRFCLGMIHGRLWIGSWTWAPLREVKTGVQYQRGAITADEAKQAFERAFQPGRWSWLDGVGRAWRFAGAGLSYGCGTVVPETGQPKHNDLTLAIPFWMLAVVFGIWPACFAARRMLKRMRFAAGLCQYCGYDLLATPDRCPECGRSTEALERPSHVS